MFQKEKVENRVFGYIDILGFTAELEKRGQEPDYLERVVTSLLGGKSPSPELQSYIAANDSLNDLLDEAASEIQLTSFSDTTVISVAGRDRADEVIALVTDLCLVLLENDFFVRGGIDYGIGYHRDGIVIGPGMLNAYYLESQSAVYPRVLVQDDLALDLRSSYTNEANPIASILRDSGDHLFYIDLFATLAMRRNGRARFEELRPRIEGRLKDSAGRVKYLARWRWVAAAFNRVAVNLHPPCDEIKLGT